MDDPIIMEMKSMRITYKKKEQKFAELVTTGTFAKLGKFPFSGPIPMPLDPSLGVTGISDRVKIFSSKLEPLGIHYKLDSFDEYQIIFKSGDDMRQDQVVIQLISLMDELLKKDGHLDLKLTPYKVLATSSHDGIMECVQNCQTIRNILRNYNNDIHNFFRESHPSQNGPFGIDPEVINTFVRSCAGYCVITYILCVGDRHLDNLMITTSGNLFHIDFGFIGRDPKPYPPPMKLCGEMIAAMGGEASNDFTLFKQLCVEAYNTLRKNANLILNLISLMADSNISDIASEKSLLLIQDKFQLEKTDEEAGVNFQLLMQESVTALFAQLSDKFHNIHLKWKSYWKE